MSDENGVWTRNVRLQKVLNWWQVEPFHLKMASQLLKELIITNDTLDYTRNHLSFSYLHSKLKRKESTSRFKLSLQDFTTVIILSIWRSCLSWQMTTSLSLPLRKTTSNLSIKNSSWTDTTHFISLYIVITTSTGASFPDKGSFIQDADKEVWSTRRWKKKALDQSWFKYKLTCPASLFSAESSSPSLSCAFRVMVDQMFPCL